MRKHLCGIQTAWTDLPDARQAVTAIASVLDHSSIAYLLFFFSPMYSAAELAAAAAQIFPNVCISGCTTSGGISPAGTVDRGCVALAFPHAGFRIASQVFTEIDRLDADMAASAIRSLRESLDGGGQVRTDAQYFALSLIDSLANAEEAVVSAVATELKDIPLVGGSAGDDLGFSAVAIVHDGSLYSNAAVLIIVKTEFPLRIFKSDSFEPTGRKFVVTAASEESRRVHELDAEPAAREYAMAVGLDPECLSPMSFAAFPLAVKIGGEYYCRSVGRVDETGSLAFFCAISEGAVLTLAKPRDIVEAMCTELAKLESALGGVDLVIAFDCVLRRLDAETRQVQDLISELYERYDVVGFETYGEQYLAMHLNQTFTGIAIGSRRSM